MSATRSRWLRGRLLTLASGTAVNSLLGPFGTGVVRSPASESVQNQTVGLEAFSLAVIVPVAALPALGPAGP